MVVAQVCWVCVYINHSFGNMYVLRAFCDKRNKFASTYTSFVISRSAVEIQKEPDGMAELAQQSALSAYFMMKELLLVGIKEVRVGTNKSQRILHLG